MFLFVASLVGAGGAVFIFWTCEILCELAQSLESSPIRGFFLDKNGLAGEDEGAVEIGLNVVIRNPDNEEEGKDQKR